MWKKLLGLDRKNLMDLNRSDENIFMLKKVKEKE